MGVAPSERIKLILDNFEKPIITSSFGSFSAVTLDLVYSLSKVPVIFIDRGDLTQETHEHKAKLIKKLSLNLLTYSPRAEESKVQVLERAISELSPDVWISGVMAHETRERANFNFFMKREDGVIKAHPILDWSQREAYQYLKSKSLPFNQNYNDPDKPKNGECGIHLSQLTSEQLRSLNSSKL